MDLTAKCVIDNMGNRSIVIYEEFNKPLRILTTYEAVHLMENIKYSLDHRSSCTVNGDTITSTIITTR